MQNKVESIAEEVKKNNAPKKEPVPGVRGPQVNPQDAELSSAKPSATNWSRFGNGSEPPGKPNP